MTWRVVRGDCVDVMRAMEPESVDAVVCDPPYGLEFMGREWDSFKPSDARFRTRVDQRTNGAAKAVVTTPEAYVAGSPFQAWCQEWATEALRVLKPGGHLLAFGGTRTYHRLAAGIEDAGFEIRDCIAWMYGSGFPKSLDVSRAIDDAAGATREVVGYKQAGMGSGETFGMLQSEGLNSEADHMVPVTAPATPEAERWDGWGTALKPAYEPVLVCAKPLTVEQRLTIIVRGLTHLIEETATWCGVSASDVDRSSSAIRARLKKGADASVLADAKTSVLVSFDLVQYAAGSSTCPAPGSDAQERTQAGSAPLNVRPSSSESPAVGRETPHGEVADLLTRLLAISTSVATEPISASIVSSWSDTSVDVLNAASRCTTETASRLTIALRTLRSFLPPNITAGTGSSSPNLGLSPIVLARKPLGGTVAATVVKHGTGALNIERCRIGTGYEGAVVSGRWPANVLLDDAAASLLDEQSGQSVSSSGMPRSDRAGNGWGMAATGAEYDDFEGASRFFFTTQKRTLEACEPASSVEPSSSPDEVRLASAQSDVAIEDNLGGSGFCATPYQDRSTTGTQSESSERPVSDTRLIPSTENEPSPVQPLDEHIRSQGRANSAATHVPTGTTTTTTSPSISAGSAEDATSADIGMSAAAGVPASRFMYTSKASTAERNAGLGELRATHPTVKPIDLMRWLVRLVTPPGGLVLDPFLGSGSTGAAAVLEGFEFVGVEREDEYAEIAEARIGYWAQLAELVRPGLSTEQLMDAAFASERSAKRQRERGQDALF